MDTAALTVAPAAGGPGSLAPGAVEALGMLADAGHQVLIVGSADVERLVDLGLPHVDGIPDDADGAWFLTGDPHTCDGRPRGCRTVFIGPTVGQRALPTRRCDDEVRDVNQAALLVLAADVMPAS